MGSFTAFTYRVPDNHRNSIVIDIEIHVPVPIQGYPQNKEYLMDILRMADMAITNAGGVTVLSLRYPSADKHIDFTKPENTP